MIHPKFVMVGGGSYAWTPALISDLLHKPSLSSAHLVSVDPDPEPLELCEQFAYFAAKKRGLDAMQHDLPSPRNTVTSKQSTTSLDPTVGLKASEMSRYFNGLQRFLKLLAGKLAQRLCSRR